MNLPNFFAELKRRNVYKVAVAYAVVAWLTIQMGRFKDSTQGKSAFLSRVHARGGNERLFLWLLRQFETRMPL